MVPAALKNLGYDAAAVKDILDWVDRKDTVEGAPGVKAEHLPVFDCAFKPANGQRSISVDGHVKMMAAVQPFLSGAISKTVNMPADATPEDVWRTYLDAWKMGLKAIAIYRDGSKKQQPVNTSKEPSKVEAIAGMPAPWPRRRKLPDERQSITHKFCIAGMDGYITVGMYEDGQPGEIFVTMAKQGSVISGLMDSFATSVSIALQYGVPASVLCEKFSHVRFEPAGYSANPQIGYAKSIVDYIFRWLALKFLATEPEGGLVPDLEATARADVTEPPSQKDLFVGQEDAPPCSMCGFVMVRSGSCYKCLNCGSTSGCS
jgi:ribonucleoside-diphosphate reductase alpha chain